MILSDQCYLRDRCKKFTKDSSCQTNAEFCIKLFKLNYLFDEALLTLNQRKYIQLYIDDDGTDRNEFTQLKQAENDIEAIIANGENFFIHSSTTGNGKTAWAIRLMQRHFYNIWYKTELKCRGLFINVPRFLLALKSDITTPDPYIAAIKANILDADIVVWDEIGTKSPSTFEHEYLLNYINARIDAGKSNIYTSNLGDQALKEVLGDRLYSRVVNNSHDIEFFGSDKRGLKI